MSITQPLILPCFSKPSSLPVATRIMHETLLLLQEPTLNGKIAITHFQQRNLQIVFIPLQQTVLVTFTQNYPQSPIHLQTKRTSIQECTDRLDSIQSWSPKTQLKQVILDLYRNIQKGQFNQLSNYTKFDNHQNDESEQENPKKRVLMNGCADNELTQTKNLNRHFRSKLREVYLDVVKDGSVPPENARWMQGCFALPRVGFEDIAKVLKNEWFNGQIKKQMENGKFMHKIMKGMMSIKSKKLMVKYYHVMLAAAKDPDNFVKWKYQ